MLDSQDKLIGVITLKKILTKLTTYEIKLIDKIEKLIKKEYRLLNAKDPLKYLTKALTNHDFVVIQDESNYYICDHKLLLNNYINKN